MTNCVKYDIMLIDILYKGAFILKKIYLALVAALMAAVIPMQVMANTPQLTAKNDNGQVAVSITNSITTKNADEILPKITECIDGVTQTITLKADAGAIASLRLVLPQITTESKTPLNNYNVIITDEKGATVYNSSEGAIARLNDMYKEMKLGEIQSGEEKTFNVTYKIIDPQVDVSKVTVELAAKTNFVPTPTPASTLKPKFDFDSLEKQNEFIFDFSNEPKNGETTDPSNKINEIRKVCGTDIPAGRFSVTGNGKLKILSAAGNVKSESVVSETPVAGKSVKTAVVLLEKDDVLSITPLEGDEKARLKFNKVTTAATTATATPVKPTDASKTNPKTGDGDVGIVIGVALIALLAVGMLEYVKRKSKTN